jgi:hypothetical protein
MGLGKLRDVRGSQRRPESRGRGLGARLESHYSQTTFKKKEKTLDA